MSKPGEDAVTLLQQILDQLKQVNSKLDSILSQL